MASLRSLAAVLALVAACDGAETAPDGSTPLPDADAPALGPLLYPSDRTQSPLTPDLVGRLRSVHAGATGLVDNVFAKIGDSHTVSAAYVACLAGATVALDGRDLMATIDHFKAGDAAGTTPYQRTSQAATVGWSAISAVSGSPSPIEREVAAIHPAFATVMFGTNDIELGRIDRYGQNLATIADSLLAQGIIPVFTTIPPRDDKPTADAQVPRYNAVMRGIAQTRGVPLVDLHRELLPLAGHGLGPDNLHLESSGSGACVFTAAGLGHGNNVRNVRTLEALDRLRRTVLVGEPAPDADGPRLAGAGTPADPFVIAQLPFADRRDTATFGTSAIASYPACGTQDERGSEVYYRIEITAPVMLHAYAIDAAADIDLHLLTSTDAATCLARGDTEVSRAIQPGTYYVVADTFGAAAGDFTIVVSTD